MHARFFALTAIAGLAVCLTGGVAAQPAAEQGDWRVQLGGVGLVSPEYEGADSYRLQAFPLADILYKNRYFLNPYNGLGVYLVNDPSVRIGTSLFYAGGRDEDRSRRLTGLGDVDGGLDLNAFVEMDIGVLTLGAKASHQVTGDDTGTRIELGGEYGWMVQPRLIMSAAVAGTYVTGQYMDTFFGITTQQAAASGYAPYAAEAGIKDVFLNLTGIYSLTGRLAAIGILRVAYLLGDAADSPITEQKIQPSLGLGLMFSF